MAEDHEDYSENVDKRIFNSKFENNSSLNNSREFLEKFNISKNSGIWLTCADRDVFVSYKICVAYNNSFISYYS